MSSSSTYYLFGKNNFKSEAYIDAFLRGKDLMYNATVMTTGRFLSGEVKLDVAIRLLSGGDALDLSVLFDIAHCAVTKILYHVLLEWIIRIGIGDIGMKKYLGDAEVIQKLVLDFPKGPLVYSKMQLV